MFDAYGIRRVCIVWIAVVTACTCVPVPCPQDSCSMVEVTNSHCKDLDTYIKCMKSLSRKCRGDISYHSVVTVMSSEFKKKCIGHDDLFRSNTSEHSQSMVPSILGTACPVLFEDKKEHKFCGLFGDPHLRTFGGKYQTCRIHGASQVIENAFFGIMVTNDAVFNSTIATVPTKLTVMLKSHRPECTHQKMYQAQGDSQLPYSFNDGTALSGLASSPTVSLSWRSNDLNSETVIIRLSYISTIITVTRVGKYLSISAKLPNELAQTLNQDKSELCSNGCPASERIDIKQVPVSELDSALTLCHNSIGPTGRRLTDQYLDWCVFDMVTSHDEQFINVSHAAYSDVLFFEPRSLFNRTISVYELKSETTTDASCANRLNLFLLIVVCYIVQFNLSVLNVIV